MISDFHGTPLSNFSPVTDLHVNGLSFTTLEAWYQAQKTTDVQAQAAIAAASTPGQAKRLGRRVALRPDWEAVKIPVMRIGLSWKFAEPQRRSYLLGTGDQWLVKGNTWGDTFWGQCPLGAGQNWLGFLLMAIRAEIRGARAEIRDALGEPR